jgi:glutamate/tyrosine decarboxylase-like PLP-dependent enzyme
MDDLIEQIEYFEKISNLLEPSEAERNEYNRQIHQYANQFINTIHTRNAFGNGTVTHGSLAIKKEKRNLADLLELYTQEVAVHGINPASGGHIGYIPGGGIYTSAIADYLADITNEYAGMYFASPGAVTIENEVISWLKQVFGFPASAVGNLTSGGSMANLIGLTAARDFHGVKNEKIKQSVVYLSPQVHHCIHKAFRIIGLEDVIIRELELDAFHRINTLQLREVIKSDIQNGLTPFCIVASAGTTDTGAVDPLEEIGNIAREYKCWYHVDAAYGGFFILTATKKHLFTGIELADSLVVDPHKGLFLPYGTGAVLIKNKEAVFHSNHYLANYMQDAQADDLHINPADVSPELTKHFRGLRLWLPLQLHGVEPFIACLEEKILLARYFRNQLVQLGFEVGPEPDLSVSYFWYPAKHMDENTFNKQLMDLIHQDGSVFLSSTNLQGKFVIRLAVLSFRTKKHTIDKAINLLMRTLSKFRKG